MVYLQGKAPGDGPRGTHQGETKMSTTAVAHDLANATLLTSSLSTDYVMDIFFHLVGETANVHPYSRDTYRAIRGGVEAYITRCPLPYTTVKKCLSWCLHAYGMGGFASTDPDAALAIRACIQD